jgi:hypothetical protein
LQPAKKQTAMKSDCPAPIETPAQADVAEPQSRTRQHCWPAPLAIAGLDAEVERIVQRTNSRLNPGGQRVDLGYVLERVRQTREQGFAFSKGAVAEGGGVIGMALPPSDSAERIAIGVGGLVSPLEPSTDSLVEAIRDSIAEYNPASRPLFHVARLKNNVKSAQVSLLIHILTIIKLRATSTLIMRQ